MPTEICAYQIGLSGGSVGAHCVMFTTRRERDMKTAFWRTRSAQQKRLLQLFDSLARLVGVVSEPIFVELKFW